MFYKITGTNGTKQKSYFTYLEGDDQELAQTTIALSAMGMFASGVDTVEPASKEDPEFVSYVNSDIEKVKKEIKAKELLLARLEGALND